MNWWIHFRTYLNFKFLKFLFFKLKFTDFAHKDIHTLMYIYIRNTHTYAHNIHNTDAHTHTHTQDVLSRILGNATQKNVPKCVRVPDKTTILSQSETYAANSFLNHYYQTGTQARKVQFLQSWQTDSLQSSSANHSSQLECALQMSK